MARRTTEVRILQDGTAAIPLTRGRVTVIDAQDADLGAVLWYAHPSGCGNFYAARQVPNGNGQRFVCLHRVILARALGRSLRPGEEVDHADGDTLNNRRANLRPASHAQNAHNRRVPVTNSSGYKGVHSHRLSNKWRARIMHNGQPHFLGLFDSPTAAARAYDAAARALFGEYARVNFPYDGKVPARRAPDGSASR